MMSSNPAPRLAALEKIVLVHIAVLLLGSTWVFGGNIGWARLGLSVWGGLALPITAFALTNKNSLAPGVSRRRAWWLLPAALYAGLVVASTFNPSFRTLSIDGHTLLVHRGPAHPNLPNTVNSIASLNALWFGAGAYLSAFNLSLVLRNRSALRWLLVFIASNTLILSIYGTLQKLSSSGFYFGAAVSPNKRYFSTFIYNNHWGAFMILVLSVATGLLFYHLRRNHGRDLWHSPFTGALLGVLIIATTAPISASRAATGMAFVLILIAVSHATVRIVSTRRRHRLSIWPPLAILAAFVLAVTSAVGWLGFKSINERYTETRLALKENQSLWSSRAELYHDTWQLAAKKPVFGWGLDSFGTAFQLIRPRSLQPERQYEASYDTAHSDWLQSVAETGFVGTGLLLLALALPLAGLPRTQFSHPLVAYPLTGLGLVLFYAWIEFPFSSAAVVIAFWTVLFTTVQFSKLTDLASVHRHE
jgi:O-antigen ligase